MKINTEYTRNLLHKIADNVPLTQIERYELHGYTCKHLFRDYWLVRKYSTNRRRFSLYHIVKIKE